MGIITFLSSLVDRYDNWYLSFFESSPGKGDFKYSRGNGVSDLTHSDMNYKGHSVLFYGFNGSPEEGFK